MLANVRFASAVRVVAHGNRFYLSIRPRDMEFWGIKSGDEVLMELSKLKRYNSLSKKLEKGE